MPMPTLDYSIIMIMNMIRKKILFVETGIRGLAPRVTLNNENSLEKFHLAV